MKPKLTIYFTSDTHGYLYPTNFMKSQPMRLGLLSMAFPKDGNTLIIDGGDTIQGSPLTYYCHSLQKPLPVARALNERGYDYITLGNHDFNNGYQVLSDYLNALDAQCLCANVEDKTHQLPISGWDVRTLANGLRVGIIGIVTNWVNRWEKPENLQQLTVSDPMEAVTRCIKEVRQRCDLLVGLYHGGLEKDVAMGKPLSDTDENIGCKLCEDFPFDLLLTGHQHIAMNGVTYCGTHIVQPPCNSSAYIKVVLDDEDRFHSELCEVKDHCVLHPAEERLFTKLTSWLDHPIGHLNHAIWPESKLLMALHGSPIADFFNQVQLASSGADISCTALGNEIRGFDSDVTVRDVVASYIYSNTLVVLEVTGFILRQALEQCATYFEVQPDGSVAISDHFLRPKEAHYNYDYFYGLEYQFDLSHPKGSRLVYLKRKGKPIQDEDKMTLCMSNYRATGAGDFDFYLRCPRVREIQTEISELILTYFSQHPTVEVSKPEKFFMVVGYKA
ncbi:MAG: bifunctional UDP-sugar hydrolase/5'-nucleotidase [Eubacteriales bacterium]|nr:bifunctional UDP-sugar hydrolase/5'-nucleotidase [Eubacteriales bacterium]